MWKAQKHPSPASCRESSSKQCGIHNWRCDLKGHADDCWLAFPWTAESTNMSKRRVYKGGWVCVCLCLCVCTETWNRGHTDTGNQSTAAGTPLSRVLQAEAPNSCSNFRAFQGFPIFSPLATLQNMYTWDSGQGESVFLWSTSSKAFTRQITHSTHLYTI